MGTTPLKLEGTNGDLKEMTTTEENYLAYRAGLHLSTLDSSDVATITTSSSGNTLIGTYTDTTFGGSAATPSDDSDDFYGYASPGGSVVTEAAADGTVPTANTYGQRQYLSDGVTLSSTPQGFSVYWNGSNFGSFTTGVDSSGWARSSDGFTYFIDADSAGANFHDYTLGNGNILKYFSIRRTRTNPTAGAPGEHGFAGGLVPVTQTTTSLYQNNGVVDFANDSDDFRYPVEFVDNGGTDELHEFDSSETDTITDRLLGRILTSEYPGTYRLGSAAPGGDWSVYKSNVFEDRLQTGTSGTAYNLYVKSSMTAPTTVRPVSIKRASGLTGTFQGLQEMDDEQIGYAFGSRVQSRIGSNTAAVGRYQLRSSAQGAPTDAGTWTAKGSATDTRYDLVNTDYSADYQRTSTLNFVGNYSRTSTQDFLGNYSRTSTQDFLGNYSRTSTQNFLGNYTRTSTRTSTRTRTSTDNFTGNYARNFVGNYLRNFSRDFVGNYTADYAGNFTGDYTRNRFDGFTGNFEGNYARNSTRTSTRNRATAYARTRATTYTANYVGNYARTRATTYTGNFVGNYVRLNVLYGNALSYARTRVTNYVGNFVGNYNRTRTANFVGNFAGNYTGDFAGNFTGDFTGNYARTSTRSSVTTYVGSSGARYSNSTNVLASSFPDWTTGTGSATGYNQNGDGNSRISDASPKGTDIVWDVSNQDAASDADGGWNTSNFNIDRTHTYRFSVWVRRKNIGNGSFYLGVGGSTVNNRTNGALNTNPYFYAGGWWDASSVNQWFLVVGHVYSNASGTGGIHADSGIYNIAGEKVVSAQADYYWTSTATQSYHRCYLYYSTDTNTNQQMWEPRVDDLSASGVPSVADLIGQSGNYLRTSTRTSQTNFARTRSSNYAGAFTVTRSSTYTRTRDSNYAGNYAGNFLGEYTVTRSSNYLGEYTVTRTSNYLGEYNVTRTSNYLGNYLGNYVGTTIDSGTSTIETYTLYARTA